MFANLLDGLARDAAMQRHEVDAVGRVQAHDVDEVLCAMADAPGDDAAMCCLCTSNFKIIKDQMNKIASAES